MDRDLLFEQQLNNFDSLHAMYESGEISLDSYERELLEFCHNTDMKKFLKEEVGEKPIVLNEDGSINYEKTRYNFTKNHVFEKQNSPIQQQAQQMKFYYLYDDNGNMIAAIPQR